MTRDWAGLVHIEVVSGTAHDPDGLFRGFVTIRAVAEDGSFMSGQLDPTDVRKLALDFLSVAEAADQDAIVFRLMVNKVGMPAEVAGNFVMDMRNERE